MPTRVTPVSMKLTNTQGPINTWYVPGVTFSRLHHTHSYQHQSVIDISSLISLAELI